MKLNMKTLNDANLYSAISSLSVVRLAATSQEVHDSNPG